MMLTTDLARLQIHGRFEDTTNTGSLLLSLPVVNQKKKYVAD